MDGGDTPGYAGGCSARRSTYRRRPPGGRRLCTFRERPRGNSGTMVGNCVPTAAGGWPPSSAVHTNTPPSAARHDAVVIGAGHNGLVCAAYLAAAGMRVCTVERRGGVVGPAVTA